MWSWQGGASLSVLGTWRASAARYLEAMKWGEMLILPVLSPLVPSPHFLPVTLTSPVLHSLSILLVLLFPPHPFPSLLPVVEAAK